METFFVVLLLIGSFAFKIFSLMIENLVINVHRVLYKNYKLSCWSLEN